jgi:hypothetical protein
MADRIPPKGLHAPITTGNSVHYDSGAVGAGPDPSTANGFLQNRSTNQKIMLWIYDFSADFGASGTEAQSRMKKDFFPRFFTQPRYLIKGQTPNQYEYQRLAKFIRLGMLQQVAGSPLQNGNPLFEAFVLRIEGRGYEHANHSTKGGHAGWTLEGYIEQIATGGERFQFAPEYEFTFVLADAIEGPMQSFDSAYTPAVTNSVRERYLSSFNSPLSPKELLPGPTPEEKTAAAKNEAAQAKSTDSKPAVPPTAAQPGQVQEGVITGAIDAFLEAWK